MAFGHFCLVFYRGKEGGKYQPSLSWRRRNAKEGEDGSSDYSKKKKILFIGLYSRKKGDFCEGEEEGGRFFTSR